MINQIYNKRRMQHSVCHNRNDIAEEENAREIGETVKPSQETGGQKTSTWLSEFTDSDDYRRSIFDSSAKEEIRKEEIPANESTKTNEEYCEGIKIMNMEKSGCSSSKF